MWFQQRTSRPDCNADALTGGAATIAPLPSRDLTNYHLPTVTELQGLTIAAGVEPSLMRNAQAEVDVAEMNLCMAQVLREHLATADVLFASANEQLELLSIIRDRAQISMLQYALLALTFGTTENTTATITHPLQILPVLRRWAVYMSPEQQKALAAIRHCAPWSATTVRFSDPEIQIAEMNGDGFPDIVRLRTGQILYWPGRGNGMWGTGSRDDCPAGSFAQDRHVEVLNAPQFGVADPGALQLADVNADGLADLVEIRFDAVDVYLNDNGTAFTGRFTLDSVPGKPNGTNPVRITDIDGSGTPDLLWGKGYDYRYIDLTGGKQPYLLSRIENGLGKTLELEYSTSAREMLAAQSAGTPWAETMPLVVPVVVRSTTRDNLELIGKPAGVYESRYSYRNPVFEGRTREFRGFSQAESRAIGDPYEPTSIERSTFLMGECPVAITPELCSPPNRWRDSWRDALRGLPAVVEVLDEAGRYLTTSHVSYEVRELYGGLDGRRVVVPFGVGTDAFAYDTAAFDGAATSVTLPELQLALSNSTATESRSVTRRATAGTARIRSETLYDDFGNVTDSIKHGCVEGCPLGVDETITTHSNFQSPPGDTSGWTVRESSSYVTGSINTAQRRQLRHVYNAAGDRVESYATLSGTVALDRRHASGGATAPNPPGASGGIGAPVEIQLAQYTRNGFGSVTATRGPNGRCASVTYDGDYEELVVADAVRGGILGGDGCGVREFNTTGVYDRGLQKLTSSTSVTGQPARFDYDGFGRLVARTFANPTLPAILAPLPSDSFEYHLPADSSATPYTLVVSRVQDGADVTQSEYRESYVYVDGLGRTIASLSEADPSKGDGGSWGVSGAASYTAKGSAFRTCLPAFWSGAPAAYPLDTDLQTGCRVVLRDAFGRTTDSYGLDGQQELHTVHHATSVDQHDAEDLGPGSHAGTPTTVISDGHGRARKSTVRAHAGQTIEEWHTLNDYLPTGEVVRISQQRAGSPDFVRWLQYDSLGRLVINAEPNTSPNFSATPSPNVQAWRYAYNDAGDLVGTSDARGCGANFHYDAAGRLLAEDYSPCAAEQPAYSNPDLTSGAGTEVLYRYDVVDPDTAGIQDAAGARLDPNAALLWGRVVSVSDRGQKSVFRYDALGRGTGVGVRVTKPGAPAVDPAERYALRWYIQATQLDAAGRPTVSTTGATVAALLGTDGKSELTQEYSRRGVISRVGGSYGDLVTSRELSADGLPIRTVLGDAASTERVRTYDINRRLKTAESFRAAPQHWTTPPGGYTPPAQTGTEPTAQLVLEDAELSYDRVGNVLSITDLRVPEEWPDSAKPVTRTYQHDDLYRVTSTTYVHSGPDTWVSPFAPENADSTREPRPSPQVEFATRVHGQTWSYDWLGNVSASNDDASGFYDRSIGTQTHGTPSAAPHQLRTASNRSTGSTRQGDLATAYDAAGNLTDLVVKRDGPCLPTDASCWQRFKYDWDELGRLLKARRWDLSGGERTASDAVTEPLPSRTADVDLRYAYAGSGDRVLKTAVDAQARERHTVYVFSTLELRSAEYAGGDYVMDARTTQVRLFAPGVTGRVVYAEESLPTLTSGQQHVCLELGDYLGSATVTLDKATGEVVEARSYQAYGATDASYRPGRWGEQREPYGFTGKEEDVEVGLMYFGARYYAPGLNRWVSPDPSAVHLLRSDPNVYAYVAGRVAVATDPDGRELLTAIAIGFLVGALISGTMNAAVQQANTGSVSWGWKGGVLGAAMAGGIAGAAAGGVGSIISGSMGTATTAAGQALRSTVVGVGQGYAGGAAGYAADSAIQGQQMEAGKFFGNALVGAGIGGAFGSLNAAALGASAWSKAAPAFQDRRTEVVKVLEGALTSAGQGAAAYAFTRAVGAPPGLALAFAASAAFNGAAAGYRGTYNWAHPTGWLAAGTDATTGLVGTTLGNLTANGASEYLPGLSYRQNRMVFNDGLAPPGEYAHTEGQTVTSVNDAYESVNHEDIHIWQSRLFGPVYQAGVVAHFVGGFPVGFVGGLPRGNAYVSGLASGYASNPFEWNAFAATGDWPPTKWFPAGALGW